MKTVEPALTSTKTIKSSDDPALLVQEFSDLIISSDSKKKETVAGKGELSCSISSILFEYLESYHIPTHFLRRLSPTEMVVKNMAAIPIVVMMRNISAGQFPAKLGVPEGSVLKHPIFELFLDNEKLGYPLINEYHCYALELAQQEEIREIYRMTSKVNAVLKAYFERREITLIDFRLKFGREEGNLLITDEISPDTCRLLDRNTKKRFDADLIGMKGGDVKGAYEEVLKRISNV